MQAAIGNVVCTSSVYQFNLINIGRLFSEGRRFQYFPGHQRSEHFILRASRSRECIPVVRLSQSSHSVEKVDVETEINRAKENSSSTWKAEKSLALLGSGGITFSTATALAEEITVDTATQATEGAADTLLSFLFTAAFIGLSILTIGVVYLSVSDWLEKRERDAMANAAGPEQEKLGAPVTKEGDRLMPKGFGKKVEKAEKGKKVEQKS